MTVVTSSTGATTEVSERVCDGGDGGSDGGDGGSDGGDGGRVARVGVISVKQ